MKLIKSAAVALAGLAVSAAVSQGQLTLNFANTPGATIQFNGTASSFQFNTSSSNLYVGSQWSITSEVGGVPSAVGLFGVVTNSPFSYGPITTTNVTVPGYGTVTIQIASVTGPFGGLNINDGLGNLLTGTVNWIQLDTFNYSGGINAGLTVNVTGLAYAGSNPDLQTLVADDPAAMNLTFQFSPGETLSQLTSGSGPYTTSFSGSISAVPEPTTAGCLLLGLGTLIFTHRFRQANRARFQPFRRCTNG